MIVFVSYLLSRYRRESKMDLARTITKVRQVRRSDSYFQIDAIVKNERGVKTEGETQD
jgi:hypothetical protein